MTDQFKTRKSIVFAGGALDVNVSGFGVKDGFGRFQFEEEEIEPIPHDEKSGCFYEAQIAKSELIFLRDELIKLFPIDDRNAVVETDELVEKVATAIELCDKPFSSEHLARAAIRAMLSSAPSAPEGDQK